MHTYEQLTDTQPLSPITLLQWWDNRKESMLEDSQQGDQSDTAAARLQCACVCVCMRVCKMQTESESAL